MWNCLFIIETKWGVCLFLVDPIMKYNVIISHHEIDHLHIPVMILKLCDFKPFCRSSSTKVGQNGAYSIQERMTKNLITIFF